MEKERKNFTNITTTGFGNLGSGQRFYKKDGTVNIRKKGLGFFDRLSWFHAMITMPRWKFWLWLCGSYSFINLFFALIYYNIGIDKLGGIKLGSPVENFAEAFFFSAQTFTTVGYGRISPMGLQANSIAAFEAFLGLLGFALASGLFYGRFAKPRAYLRFSQVALISPHNNATALMFRTVPYKNNHLMDAEVNVTLSIRTSENEQEKNVFYNLPLEVRKINSLVLNWTIVHPIDEESPLYRTSLEELKRANAELLVYIKAYDEGFSNNVVARTSYTAFEIIEGAKFRPMYHSSSSGKVTILNLDKLSSFELISLPPQV